MVVYMVNILKGMFTPMLGLELMDASDEEWEAFLQECQASKPGSQVSHAAMRAWKTL